MQHEIATQKHEIKQVEQTTCCIVGGGPGGAMLALLLARKGVAVTLLEAHMDFEREFRGDSIHPSVLNILDELGLVDRLLQLQHTEVRKFRFQTVGGEMTLANIDELKLKYPFIALLPQSKFLEFVTTEAKSYPGFHLVMGAQVDELIEENGKVCGVRYRGADGWYEVRAILTVGADGRFSRLRRLAGFEPVASSVPMDVLWFRLPQHLSDGQESGGHIGNGHIAIMLNRFEYWQIGYVIPKGGYQEIRAAGLPALRQTIAELLPLMADRVDYLQEWKQISVLSVESNRLLQWYRPGLLLIGDAAHTMSPVAGVGINYAIQDAVVAANILGDKLKHGSVQLKDLARVQRQRELPTRIIQAFQSFLQNTILTNALSSDKLLTIPPLVRLMLSTPVIRTVPARLMALGPWPAHVK
ncbi:MAG: FAD-dependent oxidoreductase [Ktedonobacteraceae bacterium]|nr:FAD-dependent oxidoreductase [Ktedonobacteraceae bacterium]